MATLTYRDAVGRALQDSLRAEPRLILIGQNIAGYTLKQMAEEFGESRIRDTSISESAMVGMAVGAAMKGWKAVVMIAYADISSVCHKAIVQSAAKMHYLTCGRLRCPVVIRLPIARFRGHGPMGNEVAVSWFYNVPDLNIVMPASSDEAYWSFRNALQRPTPTLFFEDRSIHSRSGEIAATNKEGNRGVVEVVSLGFIKPLDQETILKAASKTGRILIVQDEPPWSGYAPYVRCLLDELPSGALAVTPRIISGADQFLPYWDERPFLPSLKDIIDNAM